MAFDDAITWSEATVGKRVSRHRGLREGGAPWLLQFTDGSSAVLRTGSALATEATALRLATAAHVPEPP